MKENVASRLSTDTSLISTLITGIKKGEIKIPQFQRKYVWKEEQALDLLDSIANNYPVGSLLFWRTHDKLSAERNIGEFQLPATDDLSPTDYVLDGQQRLTVIYSCVGGNENDPGFSVIYDLETQTFMRTPVERGAHQFPLRRLFQTTQLLNFRTALQGLDKAGIYQERLDNLIKAFSDYRLPVVILKDLTVDEVCPIFERINSSGTKLSTYDLMVAATWTKAFDLNDKIDEICASLEPKGFNDIDRTTLLKCLSAVKLGTIKEKSLKTLRDTPKEAMDDLIQITEGALLKTVDLLSTEFKIHSWDFLSYEALVVILCYINTKVSALTPDQTRRVRQWFWRASFGERYKVGGENFVSNDLTVVSEFVIDGTGSEQVFGQPPGAKEWLRLPFRSNVSRSRAYILALAARGPRNLTNGALIDPAEALSIYNKKQFHHIYPKAFLRKQKTSADDNLVLNICMLAASANNKISDEDPSLYLPECILSLGDQADTVFESNLLPPPSKSNYATGDYDSFLEARVNIVSEFVTRLCGGTY